MSSSTRFSERLTTVLSTLIAAGLLAAGVTAQQSRTARPVSIESLDSDLRFQIRSAFRMTPRETEQRLELLDRVLDVFRSRPRSDADREILSAWLSEATLRSMPGSIGPLPPAPTYRKPVESRTSVRPESRKRKPSAQSPKPASKSNSSIDTTSFPQTGVSETNEATALQERRPDPRERLADSKPTATKSVPVKNLDSSEVRSKPTIVEAASTESQLVRSSISAKPTISASRPIDINMSELVARIAGYHAGLDTLEAIGIDISKPAGSRLSRQIDLLEGLVTDYRFVQLYYESLNSAERRHIDAPRRLDEAISAARQKLVQLQEEVKADFLGQYDRSLDSQLATLRQRLEGIAIETAR